MAKNWSRAILTSNDFHVPELCPNCMKTATNPVKTTTFRGNRIFSSTFYYCDSCVDAALAVNRIRWVWFGSVLLFIPGIPVYYSYKTAQKKKYPQTAEQSTWGYAARISWAGILWRGCEVEAARADWIEAFAKANEDRVREVKLKGPAPVNALNNVA